MKDTGVRWTQRFSNYKKALLRLEQAIFLSRQRPLSELEEQGLIQGFEHSYELGWNTLKDFLQNQGTQNIYGSRDAIQEAFKLGLIADGKAWMEMFKDRNRTAHAYDQQTADAIAKAIDKTYYELFKHLEQALDGM